MKMVKILAIREEGIGKEVVVPTKQEVVVPTKKEKRLLGDVNVIAESFLDKHSRSLRGRAFNRCQIVGLIDRFIDDMGLSIKYPTPILLKLKEELFWKLFKGSYTLQ